VALPLSEIRNQQKTENEYTKYSKEDIINAFQFRHATKEFDATKMITDDDIKFILETAHLSPSSFGFEPYFIVVQDPALRELIKPVAGDSFKIRYCKSFCIRLINESATGKARFSIYFVYDEGCEKMPADVIEMYSKF
jgi:nitroreductase